VSGFIDPAMSSGKALLLPRPAFSATTDYEAYRLSADNQYSRELWAGQ
jgi:hypothetical protein